MADTGSPERKRVADAADGSAPSPKRPKTGVVETITVNAPVNIAVIKYWGKRDVENMLPLNSSLSGTLHTADLCATTSVAASPDFTEDAMWLNGKHEAIVDGSRLANVLAAARARVAAEAGSDGSKWDSYHFHIVSENNFPTAAGLASSAAGYAALAYALGQLMGVEGDVSTIARVGSGSACRSVYGGWVKWEMGDDEDPNTSRAVQVADEAHWPLPVAVVVVSGAKKHMPSSKGMQLTAATSPLMPERLVEVPKRMEAIEAAIQVRNFGEFARITMLDSDNFHATCATTEPTIEYMTDVSREICALVGAFNAGPEGVRAAYTFDAGPNAVIYLANDAARDALLPHIAYYFNGGDAPEGGVLEVPGLDRHGDAVISDVLVTRVGPGPAVLTDPEASLVDPATGVPKTAGSD